MSQDILLFEIGSGGDFLIQNDDLTLVEILFQQVYILLFGGNLEASTTGSELEEQERFDWWGNTLLFSNTPTKQFNSDTERALDSVALNTSGRIDIIRAVEKDLQPLTGFADIIVDAFITDINRIEINVKVNRPGDIEDKVFQFIWDNARGEIIIDQII